MGCMPSDRWVDASRRAAFALIGQGTSSGERDRAIAWTHGQPVERVVGELVRERLDQMLLARVESSGLAGQLPSRLLELLAARRLDTVARVLLQQQVLFYGN